MSTVRYADNNAINTDESLLNNKNEHNSVNTNSILSISTHSLSEPNDLFAKSFLDVHNRLRKLHGAPNLSLNDGLCLQAQEWANRIARKRHMSYYELAGLGECITFFPFNLNAEEIVKYWYDEHRKYEYETPGWQAGTNYFTQIVWCSTQEIGVGRAVVQPIIESSNHRLASDKSCRLASSSTTPIATEEQVVVAFYRPAGNNNRAGQFALNVSKPIKNNFNT